MSRKEQKCLLSTVKLMYRLTNYNQIYTRNFSTHVAWLNVNEPHFPMATKLNCYSCMFVIFLRHNNNYVHGYFNLSVITKYGLENYKYMFTLFLLLVFNFNVSIFKTCHPMSI